MVEDPDTMNSSQLTPAQEAREVIETETRCHQAATLEPAFLVAMRYLPDLQRLCESWICLIVIMVTCLGHIPQNSYTAQPCASYRMRFVPTCRFVSSNSVCEVRWLLQVVEHMERVHRVHSSRRWHAYGYRTTEFTSKACADRQQLLA